jgi:hypothetical protein
MDCVPKGCVLGVVASKEKTHLDESDKMPTQDSKQQEVLVETVMEDECEEGMELMRRREYQNGWNILMHSLILMMRQCCHRPSSALVK